MQQLFRERGWPVVFLKLCAKDPERKDMHPFFYRLYQVGKKKGWDNIYPLKNDPMCQVVEPVKPEKGEMIFIKTTFSAFTSTPFHAWLVGKGIDRLLFTGLATSQCVETTARDASDRGFEVVLVEDAQADYEETVHNASLYSSQGVCGGIIRTAEQILRNPQID
jgi:nicotinamidase-related amidase